MNNSNDVILSKKETLPIVIVGAGTVGLMLAHDLMLKGLKIILIESGGETLESFQTNEYKNIGHKHNGISIGRTKGVGGTTNLWGGQLTEFIQNDIEKSKDFNQPEWVITWDEILKYYSIVYKKLGLTPNVPLLPEKLNTENSNADLEIFYTRWLKQPNFKFHFFDDLQKSENVKIIKNATVVGLNFEGERCISLDYFLNGEKLKVDNFNNIILTNGTIEICRLLLITAKSANCPFQSNMFIGKYFQDHINIQVGQVLKPSKLFFKRFSNIFIKGEKLQPKIRLNNSNKNDSYLGTCGFFSFDSDVAHHLDNFKQFSKALMGQSKQKEGFNNIFGMFKRVILNIPLISVIIFHYLKNNRIYVPFKSSVSLSVQSQQISILDSSLKLSDYEFDSLGRPKVLLNWKFDGNEIKKIKEFCIAIKNYLDKNNYGSLKFEKWFELENSDINGSWLEHVTDSYHQAGGTIMSISSETGVVDDNLKIHNTQNIYVCGASVMPTSSYGNITLTALALTMRLSDTIATIK